MNAEVLPFMAGATPVGSAPPVARAAKPVQRKRAAGLEALAQAAQTAQSDALAQAAQQAAHNDELLAQLRDIVTGPQARVNEARYDEFLNILSEQHDITEKQLMTLDQALTTSNAQSKAQFDNIVQRMTTSNNRIDVEVHNLRQASAEEFTKLRQAHADELSKMREEHHSVVQTLAASMDQRLRDLESAMRNSLAELSASFTAYVAENNKVRDNDRMTMFASLENNIMQTRNELTEDYTRGFSSVGGAIMEIGRKMSDFKQG
jgi:hypothetical protein